MEAETSEVVAFTVEEELESVSGPDELPAEVGPRCEVMNDLFPVDWKVARPELTNKPKSDDGAPHSWWTPTRTFHYFFM